MKKLISLFLAVLMIVATMPMAFAADPIALTEANVVEWPTFEGEMFYGQTLGEGGLKVVGGKVTADGTAEGEVVAGHFEFIDLTYQPTTTAEGASLKFLPDDTDSYAGFEIENTLNAIFNVSLTTPVLVDEINDSPIATKVASAGKRLMTSTISGGALKNPYTNEVIENAKWGWEKRTTVVNKSGFYTAKSSAGGGYKQISMFVWVGVEGDDTVPVYPAVVTELPTLDEITYSPSGNQTYGDFELKGGKAVLRGTDAELSGKFEYGTATNGNSYSEVKPQPQHRTIPVIFTPDDLTVASCTRFNIPVTVNPAPIAFLDENGNAVTEGFIFEVEPGETMSNVLSRIKAHIQAPESGVIWGIENNNDYAKNGQQYKITLIYDNANYVGTELTFAAKFKDVVVEPEFIAIGTGKWQVDCGSYSPLGIFTVYASVNGTETKIGEVKGNETLEWNPTVSGEYTVRIVYTPAEVDYFIIDEYTKELNLALSWAATIGDISTMHRCGDTVEAKVTNTGVIGWKATDTSGNPVELTLVSGTMESETFTFIMPDHNVILTPEFEAADDNGGILDGIGDIDGIDGILAWLKNLIEKIKGIFETIIEFFQSIGDMT